MEYKELSFAERSYILYERTKGYCEDYKFTHALGALLNIITGIYTQTGEWKIDVSDVVPGKNNAECREYLTNIRNGLSHKTYENFTANLSEREIKEIGLTSWGNVEKQIKLSIGEIDSLIQALYKKINAALN